MDTLEGAWKMFFATQVLSGEGKHNREKPPTHHPARYAAGKMLMVLGSNIYSLGKRLIIEAEEQGK